MSTISTEPLSKSQGGPSRTPAVNDFSIQVATPNGSGSQSSNNVLMRAVFNMGIPISGKNLFPSNIMGLPTWFTIRVSKRGYIAPKRETDFLVAINPDTAREDVNALPPGSVVLCEERLGLDKQRSDLAFYPVPFLKLAAEIVNDARMRKLVANMVYVGSAAVLLKIEMEEVEKAIGKVFEGKKKAIETNVQAAHSGAGYVREHYPDAELPYRVERMNETQGKIIIDGNSAAALGCLFAGVSVVAWYPITPSSSLCETLIGYLKKYRHDPETGEATYGVIQAEDELAAIGMAIGAGWAGARAMTATSGPGISLMGEFAGLGYFSEVPCVVFDIQRIGPSTGLPTRTSQGDVLSLYLLSHGDTKHPVLFPASPAECFEFAGTAFDLAERLQQPIFVASDLDLGMNNWMADPFEYPTAPLDRGKVLNAEDLERLGEFQRYRDVDGDGIPYRTLPGTDHPLAAFLTRGSGHNEKAVYTERPEDYTRLMDRLAKKHETARRLVPAPQIVENEQAEIGLIAYGSTDVAIPECRDQLRDEHGIETSYFRIRALPLAESLREFVDRCRRVYLIEQNRDAQMAALARLDLGEAQNKLRSILHYDGHPVTARFITEAVAAAEKETK